MKALIIAATKPPPDYNAELRQQPTSDETADYSDDDIPDKPVTAAFDKHTSKPTGDGTDNKLPELLRGS